MRKFINAILAGVGMFLGDTSNAQNDSLSIAKNTVFVELFGNGGIYSINYDRMLVKKNKIKISGRIGFSLLPVYNNIFTYPLELSAFYGKKHNVEIGIGYTPVFNLYNENIFKIYDMYSYAGARLGYRFQKENDGFFLKAGFMYVMELYDNYRDYDDFPYWFGVGFGRTFKTKIK